MSSTSYPHCLPLGDQTVIMQFEKEVSFRVNSLVHTYAALLKDASIRGVLQIVPTYASLAISYDPVVISYRELVGELEQLRVQSDTSCTRIGRTIHVPIVYGGDDGPDLAYVAKAAGLYEDEVAGIHYSTLYFVYMLGFIASYPYCGDVDPRIALPRRSSPRIKVKKGSVAIANSHTIVYPITSPGGWHVIGRTPMVTFNPHSEPPSVFMAGDSIKFEPITADEAMHWNEQTQREWNTKWNVSKL